MQAYVLSPPLSSAPERRWGLFYEISIVLGFLECCAVSSMLDGAHALRKQEQRPGGYEPLRLLSSMGWKGPTSPVGCQCTQFLQSPWFLQILQDQTKSWGWDCCTVTKFSANRTCYFMLSLSPVKLSFAERRHGLSTSPLRLSSWTVAQENLLLVKRWCCLYVA